MTAVVARRRLIRIGVGWVTVAVLEAAAYTALAFSIAAHWSPWLVLAVTLVSLAVTVLVSRAGFVSGVRLAGDLYSALGLALARAKPSWFTQDRRALVAEVAGRGIPSMMGVPAHQLQSYLVAPLLPVLLLIGIWILGGPRVALIVGGLLIAALVGQGLAQRWLARADATRHEAEHAATTATLELIDHLELLRTASGPSTAIARAEAAWRGQEAALARTNLASAPAMFISVIATVLPLAGLSLVLSAGGGMPPATMLALVLLTLRAAAPLEALALAGLGINQLRETIADYRSVRAAPALPEPTKAAVPAGNQIELIDVGHSPVLRGVTAHIPEGARVVVTGPTGSGKSTLLGLLMRFDDPDAGLIMVGGVSLRELGSSTWAERIAYVPQDAFVFTGTLAENVLLGRPEASDIEIERAVRLAALGGVLDRSPLGVHQDVGQQGAALSGGERQRVAIARALLKAAPILFLDEATSALDDGTEREIAAVIRELDATVIIVTHRDQSIWAPTRTIRLEAS
ncbi:ABC transporter [Kocuria polaris]|nr:ABC transporter [Kocuria polaris]